MSVRGYEEFNYRSAGLEHPVLFRLARDSSRAVIVMHELYGVTPEHLALTDRLVGDRFSVYIPVLFGDPGTRASASRLLVRCVSREIRCLAKNESSPVTTWLRSLCTEVHGRHGGSGVGVVGMCLTGGFVLSTMIEPAVKAPVMCQPSLPFVTPMKLGIEASRREAFGVSHEDLAAAKERHANGVALLGMRYVTDRICPKERMDRLEREFPSMRRIELDASEPKHATLTYNFSQAAYDELLAFLRRHLP